MHAHRHSTNLERFFSQQQRRGRRTLTEPERTRRLEAFTMSALFPLSDNNHSRDPCVQKGLARRSPYKR